MDIEDKLRQNAAPLLQPGETIQSVFAGQTVKPYFLLITVFTIIAADAFRVVVVTDRRILVCRSARLSMTTVKKVGKELPRTTRIGEPHGLWWPCDSLGERIYINKRFHEDVRRADSLLPAA